MGETIYALSSGVGRAGVAVIRISGSGAANVARLMASDCPAPRSATLVPLRHPVSGGAIDRALALWFPGPNSFTGEDVLELHVHGGRAVIAATLDALSGIGDVRPAEPGEFTRRAFANGKLDLSSVEGLADLIAADTELQRRQALKQFSGVLRNQSSEWRRKLVDARALIEAHLDFADEGDIPEDVTEEVRLGLEQLASSLRCALEGRGRAEIIRDGAVVLIAGPPNSGKSTLLNRIVSREASIISSIPGTTRDLIEITTDIRGLPITFIDSAGIRDTSDPVELEGISRTRARAEHASVVLWLESAAEPECEPQIRHPVLLRVVTKRDLCLPRPDFVSISAATGEGVQEMLDRVYDLIIPTAGSAEPTLLTTRRQFDCVQSGLEAVDGALASLRRYDFELVAEDLGLASKRLAELTGTISHDDLLDEVFGRFCLGK